MVELLKLFITAFGECSDNANIQDDSISESQHLVVRAASEHQELSCFLASRSPPLRLGTVMPLAHASPAIYRFRVFGNFSKVIPCPSVLPIASDPQVVRWFTTLNRTQSLRCGSSEAAVPQHRDSNIVPNSVWNKQCSIINNSRSNNISNSDYKQQRNSNNTSEDSCAVVSSSESNCNRFASLPSRLFATDGSGGDHSSVPHLRRCAWGVVELWAGVGWSDCCSAQVSRALWGPLSGIQTVYRAELFAIVMLLRVAPTGNMLVVVDNLPVVSQWAKGSSGIHTHLDGDLWAEFWYWVDRREGCTLLFWFPSHMSVGQFEATGLLDVVYFSNSMADLFASRAAGECQVQAQGISRLHQLEVMVSLVHKRLLAIMLKCFEFETPTLERPPPRFVAAEATRAIRLSRPSILAKVFSGVKRWQCSKCGGVAPPTWF